MMHSKNKLWPHSLHEAELIYRTERNRGMERKHFVHYESDTIFGIYSVSIDRCNYTTY